MQFMFNASLGQRLWGVLGLSLGLIALARLVLE
jgi:hypothetical protein